MRRLTKQFLLEGIPAILFGIFTAFALPNCTCLGSVVSLTSVPETARFLTEEERALAITRLGVHAPKATDKHLVWREVWTTLKALDFWLFATTYYYLNVSALSRAWS